MVALATTDEAVTRKNQNATVAEVLAGLPAIGEVAQNAGSEFVVGIANSFFAWGSGLTPEAKRMEAVEAAVQAGASGVYLACTTGMEDPKQVFDGIVQVKNQYPKLQVGVHLHARNGMALATALASMQAGVDWLEGSFGGLGGDLWAPGPPEVLGNAPLEDLVHLMDSIGVRTGIHLDSYLKVVRRVAELTGWQSTAAVVRGGTRDDLTQVGVLDSWAEDGGE
jgi:hydroxymethylglutaryl-CoA lyase